MLLDIKMMWKLAKEMKKTKKADKITLMDYMDIINNPEKFEATASIEGDEIVIKIKKKRD